MPELTAAQVLTLSALDQGRPMTTDELTRAVADLGMYLNSEYISGVVQYLTEQGLAELTPAVSLGKFRITTQGRAWLASPGPRVTLPGRTS
jgi:hypothetical protein